eukprot:COSAG04_NODE_14589_length_562_cov_1.023758_1_plen_106_part_10
MIQDQNGGSYLTSSDLELGADGDYEQLVLVVFSSVHIDQPVQSAHIRFQSDKSESPKAAMSQDLTLSIVGQLGVTLPPQQDESNAQVTLPGDISNRSAYVTASVLW